MDIYLKIRDASIKLKEAIAEYIAEFAEEAVAEYIAEFVNNFVWVFDLTYY